MTSEPAPKGQTQRAVEKTLAPGAELQPRAVGINEAARLISVSPKTLKRMIKRRDIEALKIGNRWRVTLSGIDNFLRTAQFLQRNKGEPGQ